MEAGRAVPHAGDMVVAVAVMGEAKKDMEAF